MDINPFWILVVLFVLTPESTLIIGSEIAPPSMNNPKSFEPEIGETEMPPFDDSFIEEFLSSGPLEGNRVLANSGTSGVPKDIIAEYLKSIIDFFKF